MEDWNELRLVLAIARARSLTHAAKNLALDHSTVFRRLNTLEQRLGVQLFERLPGGAYQPSAAGERMAAAAERVEEEALALEREIAGRDHRLSGRLRVTSSETLAYRLLTRQIAAFREVHPGIVVELAIDNRVLSLSRREADIALRPIRPKEGDLWGRKLADVAWAVYGSVSYMQATGPLPSAADLRHHRLVGWDEGAAGIGAASWLLDVAGTEAFVYRTTSLINQLIAAKAGVGLAVLPCYLGDPEPGLLRAQPDPLPELATELWIVAHADLKRTARVRAFFDIVGDGLSRERNLLSGKALPPPDASPDHKL
jgi:DNA-binding transcriptional LysR family regulator